MKKSTILSLLLSFFFFNSDAQLQMELVQYATGFSSPVDIANAGDERLFIVEKAGRIKIIHGDGTIHPNNFLDISSKVLNNQSERGLLGLAFHPNYSNNLYLYVNYTNLQGNTVISRFSTANDPNTVDPNSEVILMTIDQPQWNHNGGCIRFGPDGYLYIGMGDGGSGNDPWDNSQNPQELLGKMLRIDVDNGNPYAIPADNPFVNDPDVLDEIWAIGVRNPWRFSFDKETGDMWMGDVGQNAREEINFEPVGQGGFNYGWNCREGKIVGNIFDCDDNATYTDPVFDYVNPSVGKSVTGGYVYRGSEYPALYGKYIFGDYVTGRIWTLENQNGEWVGEEQMNWENNQISSYGEDMNGELYMAAYNFGRIYKVTEKCGNFGLTVSATQNVACFGGEDGAISLELTGNGDPTAIQWSNGMSGAEISGLSAGEYSATVINADGCSSTIEVTITEPSEITFEIESEVIPGGGGVVLSVSVDFASYAWYFEGNLVGTEPTLDVVESGNYTLEVIDHNGCMTAEDFFIQVSNVNEISSLTEIKISPNPFENNFNLELISDKNTDLKLHILTIGGKVLFEEKINVNGTFRKQYDLSDYASGVYLLYLRNKEGKAIQRILKE